MPANFTPLVLASASRYRRELLTPFAPDLKQEAADVDESPQAGEAPAGLAARLASAKAEAVAARHTDAIVIGSDQVAALGDIALGKPGNHQSAASQLAACSGESVCFYTAVAVIHQDAGFSELHTDITVVSFRELSSAEIDHYLRIDEPWDCAGSFRAEGLGAVLFDAMETHDPSAIIGLPMIWLLGALRRAGFDPIGTPG
jgi:septum formation protein